MLEARIEVAGYRSGFTIRDVNIRVDNGEVLVVTGPSGSGKTTLLRALTCTLDRVEGFVKGSISLNGIDICKLPPQRVYELITYIPQEPWYSIVGYTVRAEHCYVLSLMGVKCHHTILDRLGLSGKYELLTVNLSAGETQRLLWAEVVAKKSPVILLDEPLVYLDEEGRGAVRHIIREAVENKASIVLVDHNPLFWRDLADKLLVLEGGVVKYYGRWVDNIFDGNVYSHPAGEVRRANGVSIEALGVWFKYPGGEFIVKDFSLTVKRGSIVGLIGRNGSGKTTILKLLAGILRPTRGVVRRYGRAIYVPENPLLYFTKPTAREELLYMARYRGGSVDDVVELFGLTRVLDRPLAKLSSGERRRLAIASAYLANADIYLVDEPTGGLDDSSAASVIEAILHLASRGKTVVIATHDTRVVRVLDEVVRLGG